MGPDGDGSVRQQLSRFYAGAGRASEGVGPIVVFVDESKQTRGADPFYLVSAVTVRKDRLYEAFHALGGGQSGLIHATEMLRTGQHDELRDIMRTASGLHERADVFVEPIELGDRGGERARARALSKATSTLWRDTGADRFVLDHRAEDGLDQLDIRTIAAQHRSGGLSRSVRIQHARPSQERLLQAADLVASAARQQVFRDDPSWIACYEGSGLELHGARTADAAPRLAAMSRVAQAPQGRVGRGVSEGGQFASKLNSRPAHTLIT